MPPDAQFAEEIASTVVSLHLAIEGGAPAPEILGHICILVNRMIEHRDTAGRPSDAALVRAILRT